MAKDRMAHAMAETLIGKVVTDMKNDPERGLRNIIDLFLIMPREKFSENLFSLVQRMLSNEDSAYYTLVKKVASDVSSENLKRFAVNIAFNSCGKGAKMIRERSCELGFPIPWSISIGEDFLEKNNNAVKKIVTEGKELGTYLYLIFGPKCMDDSVMEVYRENNDCAFILFMDSKNIRDINKFDGINNVLISIAGDDRDSLAEAADVMHKYSRFFAYHRYYDDENMSCILDDSKMEAISDYTNSFVFFIPKESCSKNACLKTKEELRKIRDTQKYAYIPIDIKSDVSEIEETISEGSYSVFFIEDGKTLTSKGKKFAERYDVSNEYIGDYLKKMYLSLK